MQRKFYFTNAKIKALESHSTSSASTECEYTDDSSVSGLKLLVGKSGSKRFLLRYTFQSRKRSIAIGKFGDIDVQTARTIAKKYRAQIAGGIDPKAERDSYRQIPTISDFFWNTYLTVIKTNKRSWKKDLQRFKDFIEPQIGDIRYTDLKPVDVLYLQQQIANPEKISRVYSKATNNRVISVVKTMTNYALKLGIVENNVASPISLLRENNIRERYFDINESKRIIKAALEFHNPYIGSAIAMLFITGNRKGEIFNLKWSNFDRTNRTIFVEHSKNGKTFYIYLSDLAFNIIAKLERKEGNPYIFAGRKRRQPIKEVRVAYRNILGAAGIKDFTGVCFHSARISCATNLVASGQFSQIHVKQQLAHSSINSSARYIRETPQSARNISQGFSDLLKDSDSKED